MNIDGYVHVSALLSTPPSPSRMFGAFTLDSIMSVAFGRITDVQSGKEDRLSQAAAKVFSLTRGTEAIHPLRLNAISSMHLKCLLVCSK